MVKMEVFKMKFGTMAFLLAACVGALAQSPLKMEKNGTIRIGGHAFFVTHYGESWKNLSSQAKAVRDGTLEKSAEGGVQTTGTFPVYNGTFRFRESMTPEGKESFRCRIQLDSPQAIPTRQLALQFPVNPLIALTRPLMLNGKTFGFQEKRNEKRWNISFSGAKKIEIPLAEGTLIVEGNLSGNMVDGRMYSSPNWEIRLDFSPSKGAVKTASLEFTLRYLPLKSTPLDLRSVMNMGFADKVAGDGKGGWSDQGPDNDMSSLKPGELNFNGLKFDVVDPGTNDGKSCIAMKSARMTGMPQSVSVEFENPARGKFLYVLHALSFPGKTGTEIGEIACKLDSVSAVEKQTRILPVVSGVHVGDFWMPRNCRKGIVAWRGSNISAPVGLYATCYELTGEPVRRITFTSRGNANWLIVGATLADVKIDSAISEPVTIRAGKDWLPIRNPGFVKPGSAIDFSRFLDAPAGKYGRVVSKGNHFEFENRPGVPFRFYGSNIVYQIHYQPKDRVDKVADHYAATGYNILRMHMFDIPQSVYTENGEVKIRPEYMDKLDYLVAALKKRGVYITLDLFGTRSIGEGELPEFPGRKFTHREFKGLMFVSESALKNYESYVAGLMNHVNPYTGLAWKDDPVIATVSLVNEGTIFNSSFRGEQLPLWQAKFGEWLKARNLSPNDSANEKYRREFLMELYTGTYRRLARFYKETLGVKAPLTDQNFWTNIPLAVLREQFDYVDNHFYWAHPVFPNGGFNSLPSIVMNESAVGRYAGGVSTMFISRILGKPFTITEWDYANPNCYNVEGAFLTGAYAALQDWSGLCRFNYAQDVRQITRAEMPLMWFFPSVNDPLRLLSERAGFLFFVRGDVQASKVVYPFLITPDYLKNPQSPDDFPSLPNRLGLIGRVGTVTVKPGKPTEYPAGTRALLGVAQSMNVPFPYIPCGVPQEDLVRMTDSKLIPAGCYDPTTDVFTSSTGELRLERQENKFRVVTPFSEGFVLKENQVLKGDFASVTNRLCFGAFLIASIDSQPLAKSERMLILHLTDTKNSGMRFSGPDMNTCEDYGKLPLLVRRGEAELTLNRSLDGFRCYALNLDGFRFAEVPMTVKNGSARLSLRTAYKGNVIAAYELILNSKGTEK